MATPLDVDQLRSFVAIVDSGSFTKASEIVHKTQSAISMQMRRLEERVGKPLFVREGRHSRLSEEGEKLLAYARRIVKLSYEALDALADVNLTGHVTLGVPDDYADRYLPAILARFAHSNPQVEVTVICEPTPMLAKRIAENNLDLAIITHTDRRGPARIIRQEKLQWVTFARGTVQDDLPLPLALGRPTCDWRRAAVESLEAHNRPYRVLYASWNSTAVGAAVLAGLAVSVLPESAVRPDMRVLTPADGFPALPSVKIGLMRNPHVTGALIDALADHIVASLTELGEEASPSLASPPLSLA